MASFPFLLVPLTPDTAPTARGETMQQRALFAQMNLSVNTLAHPEKAHGTGLHRVQQALVEWSHPLLLDPSAPQYLRTPRDQALVAARLGSLPEPGTARIVKLPPQRHRACASVA